MDESSLRDFRELLECGMRGLSSSGRRPHSMLSDHCANDPMDEVDMASHHRDQALVHTFQHRHNQLAQEISSALQRIEEGEFGTCCICSNSIGLGRLRARPTAMLCIRCQQAMESVKRRFAGARGGRGRA